MSDLHTQYKDSTNLNARAAIYRFGVGGGFGPGQVFDLMLKAVPADADVSGGRLWAGLAVEEQSRAGAAVVAHSPHGPDARHDR